MRATSTVKSSPARLIAALALSFAASLGFSSVARADDYQCPPGQVVTGTADEQATGSNCSFYLMASFPQGGLLYPKWNSTLIPSLDVIPVWRTTRGAGVTVAVIDTGVDPNSEDLQPNLLPGYNFFDHNTSTTDSSSHGTVLASVIAAPANNGGYVGIAPEAKILPVKIMGGVGGGESDDKAAVAGIYYAIKHGARVLNCSWGGMNDGGTSPAMAKALRAAEAADVLVVVAAGNDGVNLDERSRYTEFPDTYGYGNVLRVANFSNHGDLDPTSNYGERQVQIASIGTDLMGDAPDTFDGGYVGGTSAATATVSGVAALLFSAYPAATAGQVRRAIITGANHDVPSVRGKVEANGLLSAPGALAAMATPENSKPGAFHLIGPAARFHVAKPTTVRLAWSASKTRELEGYRLVLDGSYLFLAPTTTVVTVTVPKGRNAWSVTAMTRSGQTRIART